MILGMMLSPDGRMHRDSERQRRRLNVRSSKETTGRIPERGSRRGEQIQQGRGVGCSNSCKWGLVCTPDCKGRWWRGRRKAGQERGPGVQWREGQEAYGVFSRKGRGLSRARCYCKRGLEAGSRTGLRCPQE